MKGRKPYPTQLHIVRGTKPRQGGGDQEPQFTPVDDFPPPPDYLTVDGVALWNELGRELVANKILQVVDLYALAQLAYTWQRFIQRARAGSDIAAADSTALKGLFSEFGATPAARRRVAAHGVPTTKNRFAKFASPASS